MSDLPTLIAGIAILSAVFAAGAAIGMAFELPVALVRNRRSRRGCCRACGYSLAGLAPVVCPECGWEVGRRSRASLSRALVLVPMALALGGVAWSLSSIERWPSALLLRYAAVDSSDAGAAWVTAERPITVRWCYVPTEPVLAELVARLAEGRLSHGATRGLCLRMLEGAPWLLADGLMAGADRQDGGVLRIAGVRWLTPLMHERARLEVRGPGGWQALAMVDDPLKAEATELRFDMGLPVREGLAFRYGLERAGGACVWIWEGEVFRALPEVGRPAFAYGSPLASAAVSRLPTWRESWTGNELTIMTLLPSSHIGPGWIEWAVGARVEVLLDGRVIGSGPYYVPTAPLGAEVQWLMRPNATLITSVERVPDAELEIRFVGEPGAVREPPRRFFYWVGETGAAPLEQSEW